MIRATRRTILAFAALLLLFSVLFSVGGITGGVYLIINSKNMLHLGGEPLERGFQYGLAIGADVTWGRFHTAYSLENREYGSAQNIDATLCFGVSQGDANTLLAPLDGREVEYADVFFYVYNPDIVCQTEFSLQPRYTNDFYFRGQYLDGKDAYDRAYHDYLSSLLYAGNKDPEKGLIVLKQCRATSSEDFAFADYRIDTSDDSAYYLCDFDYQVETALPLELFEKGTCGELQVQVQGYVKYKGDDTLYFSKPTSFLNDSDGILEYRFGSMDDLERIYYYWENDVLYLGAGDEFRNALADMQKGGSK